MHEGIHGSSPMSEGDREIPLFQLLKEKRCNAQALKTLLHENKMDRTLVAKRFPSQIPQDRIGIFLRRGHPDRHPAL